MVTPGWVRARTVTVHDEDGGERVLRARVVLLATGSRPHHPPSIPFDDPDVHDSETVLSIERPPQRVVAIGGGPVGCEYASIFATLGVQVTLVDRGTRLLPLLDRELSAELAHGVKRAGVRLMLGTHSTPSNATPTACSCASTARSCAQTSSCTRAAVPGTSRDSASPRPAFRRMIAGASA